MNVEKAPGFPCWLKTSTVQTNQTSGISFIKEENNRKIFLLADDVGSIHKLTITDDTSLALRKVVFSEEAEIFLQGLPKADFEEIYYDRYSGNVYIAIEGNEPDFIKSTGIFKINFTASVNFDTIQSFERINITPEETFNHYLAPNTGYEGFTADENYFYLGLEGFSEAGFFADSTIILVADKKNLNIVKEISTKDQQIHTICGLFSDRNNSLFGIDRNNKKLFHIILDDNLNIKNFEAAGLQTNIPGYADYDYTAALESLTMDEEANIFLTDDPWTTFFIPSEEILNELNKETRTNFENFVPVIYKYRIKSKGEYLE
jgi:hypothetical protein